MNNWNSGSLTKGLLIHYYFRIIANVQHFNQCCVANLKIDHIYKYAHVYRDKQRERENRKKCEEKTKVGKQLLCFCLCLLVETCTMMCMYPSHSYNNIIRAVSHSQLVTVHFKLFCERPTLSAFDSKFHLSHILWMHTRIQPYSIHKMCVFVCASRERVKPKNSWG